MPGFLKYLHLKIEKVKNVEFALKWTLWFKKIPVYAFVMLTAEKFQNVSENAFIVP